MVGSIGTWDFAYLHKCILIHLRADQQSYISLLHPFLGSMCPFCVDAKPIIFIAQQSSFFQRSSSVSLRFPLLIFYSRSLSVFLSLYALSCLFDGFLFFPRFFILPTPNAKGSLDIPYFLSHGSFSTGEQQQSIRVVHVDNNSQFLPFDTSYDSSLKKRG